MDHIKVTIRESKVFNLSFIFANGWVRPSEIGGSERRLWVYPLVMSYIARVVDDRVEALLRAMGGVVIEGARACGKTSTGLEHARSEVRLDSDQAARLAELDPA
ncbi:MAG: hypothetical protein LBD90_00935, partial [Bifidobacteriaceae bacterium]|nr:hypothetical protein [Bifidobacteriaceae bacterium]